MDTILYLYAKRNTCEDERKTENRQAEKQPEHKKHFSRLRKIFSPKDSEESNVCEKHFDNKHSGGREEPIQIKRTEYLFSDYRLVKVAVMGCADNNMRNCHKESEMSEQCCRNAKWGKRIKIKCRKTGKLRKTGNCAEVNILTQLYELTEDPDHTYVVCREPLSLYYGREFREYRQQNWVEHLLQYGEKTDHLPVYPDFILLGRNTYLPYIILRYACGLQSIKWYLTDREYREDEEWLVDELEDEYGLIAEVSLLPTTADYARVQWKETHPCVVLDFCDSEKVHGGGLPVGSIWLDFAASEEKERRLAGQCPQIRYFSLKKEWKEPRKALEYLDIISKNGYNNPVD